MEMCAQRIAISQLYIKSELHSSVNISIEIPCDAALNGFEECKKLVEFWTAIENECETSKKRKRWNAERRNKERDRGRKKGRRDREAWREWKHES